jgi:hypothetical protein
MDSIIIGFSKPKKWKIFSWLIMTGYNIPYDHVYIRWYSSKLNRDIVYQASGMTVNFMGQQFFDNNDVIEEFCIPITPGNKLAMVQFAMDNAGKPYGIKECFGLAWVRICQLFGKTIKNPFNADGTTYVCSELAGFLIQEYAGIEVDSDIADITPLELYNTLKSINTKQIK